MKSNSRLALGLLGIIGSTTLLLFLYQNFVSVNSVSGSQLTPVRASRLSGSITQLDGSGLLEGWALNMQQPETAVDIEILINGQTTGRTVTNRKNSVFNKAVCESCQTGFQFQIPAYLNTGQPLQVEVFAIHYQMGRISLGQRSFQFTNGGSSQTFEGTDNDDVLIGTANNDTLIGRKGNDSMHGDWGDDTYVIYPNDGVDLIEDAGGQNSLRCEGGLQGDCYMAEGSQPIIQFASGSSVRLLNGLANMNLASCVPQDTQCKGPHSPAVGIQFKELTSTSDQYTGNDNAELIVAYDGLDVVYGMGGNDTIIGGKGDDTLSGNIGDDYIRGGGDNDILYGGRDNDILYGDTGNDTLHGDAGNDLFVYRYGDGDDTVIDSADANRIQCVGVQGTTRHEGTDVVIQFANGSIRLKDGTAPSTNYDSCLKR